MHASVTTGLFVTGTDTGIGKTFAAAALLRACVESGRRAVGMKPIAAGVDAHAGVNADVAALDAAGNVAAPLADRNPYAFAPAIAPHVAAAQAGVVIDLDIIDAAYRRLSALADAIVVEGAGGPLVPLDAHHDMLDIAKRLALPVVMVVGVRLGCLHLALAAELAIRARGLVLAGWIANRIDPAMPAAGASVAALVARLPAPLVADLAWGDATLPPDALARLATR